MRLASHGETPRTAKRPARKPVAATARRAAALAARLAFVVASFVAVFLPARTASAFGGVDALAAFAGLCDPVGASAPAPAPPFVMVEDEATLVASALAAGITDPRGASMNAPLALVVPEGFISALDDARCEKADGAPAIRQASDDHRNAPDATPVADFDPAVPASLTPPPFVLVREEALPSLTRDDVPRPAHTRVVEHPPRLAERSIRASSRVRWLSLRTRDFGCVTRSCARTSFSSCTRHPQTTHRRRLHHLPLRVRSPDLTRTSRGRCREDHRCGPFQSSAAVP